MARSLASQQNIEAPDSDYPFGRIKDDNGTGNGTQLTEQVHGDFFQFFEKMMDNGGIVHNGLPDGAYPGFQLFQSLLNTISFRVGSRLSANLDDELYAGIFNASDTDANIPDPSIMNAQLIVSGKLNGTVRQVVIDLDNGAEWRRTYTGGVWFAWILIKLPTKVVEIGNWDMSDTANDKNVAHGFADFTKIRGVSVIVRNDGNTLLRDLIGNEASGIIQFIDSTNVVLGTVAAGIFDNTNYDNVSTYNRGWVTITYTP